MAKDLPPIEETLAWELLSHFEQFVKLKNAIPIERAFWRYLIRNSIYTHDALPEHVFRYQFGRLIHEGYIAVERQTRSLSPARLRMRVEDA